MKWKRRLLKSSIFCLFTIPVLFFSSIGFCATFCVSNATELHDALATAESNGEDDTIQVVQGTYYGNFIYASTESENLSIEGGYTEGCASRTIEPANTILDGGGINMALALVSQGAAVFNVGGLTLQNGNTLIVDDGGGLYAITADGNVILTNNTFTGNSAKEDGGGAYVKGTATLINNIFTGNTGGGAYINGTATLTNNTFTENIGDRGASIVGTATLNSNTFTGNNNGGVHISGGATLTNNTFIENRAASGGGAYVNGPAILIKNTYTGNTTWDSTWIGGGGAYIEGTATLTGNTFTENTASGWGGGGVSICGNASLNNNIFTGNTTLSHGGGLKIVRAGDEGYNVILTNNVFIGNIAERDGGGAYIHTNNGDISLTNNTFTGNTAGNEGQGGGIWIKLESNAYTISLYNNIIWNNTASTGSDLFINNAGDDPFFNPVTVNLFNNDFDQSASGTYIVIPFTIDPSNLDNEDPLFVGGEDYRLTASSPCINRGNNDAPGLPAEDKDGKPRIIDDIVDMGAYEGAYKRTLKAMPWLNLLLLN